MMQSYWFTLFYSLIYVEHFLQTQTQGKLQQLNNILLEIHIFTFKIILDLEYASPIEFVQL